MDLGLSGRVFVVSGGSRGLGYAAAMALRAEGAHVVLAARDPAGVARAAADLGAT
ncbi:MAG: SDR family NAD(P)-dependent oxidoreductase, partial [Actinomycetota bacterium]|nr:SDR family NAD(P)-dependent oxidoreductase [Actinomycetota bacterium]